MAKRTKHVRACVQPDGRVEWLREDARGDFHPIDPAGAAALLAGDAATVTVATPDGEFHPAAWLG